MENTNIHTFKYSFEVNENSNIYDAIIETIWELQEDDKYIIRCEIDYASFISRPCVIQHIKKLDCGHVKQWLTKYTNHTTIKKTENTIIIQINIDLIGENTFILYKQEDSETKKLEQTMLHYINLNKDNNEYVKIILREDGTLWYSDDFVENYINELWNIMDLRIFAFGDYNDLTYPNSTNKILNLDSIKKLDNILDIKKFNTNTRPVYIKSPANIEYLKLNPLYVIYQLFNLLNNYKHILQNYIIKCGENKYFGYKPDITDIKYKYPYIENPFKEKIDKFGNDLFTELKHSFYYTLTDDNFNDGNQTYGNLFIDNNYKYTLNDFRNYDDFKKITYPLHIVLKKRKLLSKDKIINMLYKPNNYRKFICLNEDMNLYYFI